MILSEAIPNKLYSTSMMKPFFYNFNKFVYISASNESPVDFILYVLSNTSDPFQRIITYEILAGSANILYASFPTIQPIEEVALEDLPLFINLKYKAPNFDLLLKGDPFNPSSLHSTITFRSTSPSILTVR